MFKHIRPLQQGDHVFVMFDSGKPWRIELDDDELGRPFFWIERLMGFHGDTKQSLRTAHQYMIHWSEHGLRFAFTGITTRRQRTSSLIGFQSFERSLRYITMYEYQIYIWYLVVPLLEGRKR